MIERFLNLCNSIACDYKMNEPLKGYSSFKIGGNASIIVFPDSAEKAAQIISFCSSKSIPMLTIGKGSNLLFSDNEFKGVILCTKEFKKIELIGENEIRCESGASLSNLCHFALQNSLTGLEFAYGIPGTAGGAAYMNAGAYGGEMKDVLFKCEHITQNGATSSFSGDELKPGYRTSVYSSDEYFISALYLKLQKGDPTLIKEKMDELMCKRRDKQPLEYPSAGSTFKRPEGYYAGALIEQCGLKGFSIGGAQVSEKHAGFVINKNNATAQDVIDVIKHCRETVFNKTGVTLETEVKIIN